VLSRDLNITKPINIGWYYNETLDTEGWAFYLFKVKDQTKSQGYALTSTSDLIVDISQLGDVFTDPNLYIQYVSIDQVS
jgi:poly-D-alanine transfer protein DltD